MTKKAAIAGSAVAILLLATSCCAPATAVSLRHSSAVDDATVGDPFEEHGGAGDPFDGYAVSGPMDEAQHPALLEVDYEQGTFESLTSWLHSNETFHSLRDSIIRDRHQIEVLPISNCSAKIRKHEQVPGIQGFQFSHFGHFSDTESKHIRQNISDCVTQCLDEAGCNAFSFENNGRVPYCLTYVGKLPTYSRIARSYKKCSRHERARDICLHSDGINNYTFTHEGWFPNGIVMNETANPKRCSRICDSYDACTAFSWLKPHKENLMKPQCMMFTGRRTQKSEGVAYTRCFLTQHDTMRLFHAPYPSEGV